MYACWTGSDGPPEARPPPPDSADTLTHTSHHLLLCASTTCIPVPIETSTPIICGLDLRHLEQATLRKNSAILSTLPLNNRLGLAESSHIVAMHRPSHSHSIVHYQSSLSSGTHGGPGLRPTLPLYRMNSPLEAVACSKEMWCAKNQRKHKQSINKARHPGRRSLSPLAVRHVAASYRAPQRRGTGKLAPHKPAAATAKLHRAFRLPACARPLDNASMKALVVGWIASVADSALRHQSAASSFHPTALSRASLSLSLSLSLSHSHSHSLSRSLSLSYCRMRCQPEAPAAASASSAYWRRRHCHRPPPRRLPPACSLRHPPTPLPTPSPFAALRLQLPPLPMAVATATAGRPCACRTRRHCCPRRHCPRRHCPRHRLAPLHRFARPLSLGPPQRRRHPQQPRQRQTRAPGGPSGPRHYRCRCHRSCRHRRRHHHYLTWRARAGSPALASWNPASSG